VKRRCSGKCTDARWLVLFEVLIGSLPQREGRCYSKRDEASVANCGRTCIGTQRAEAGEAEGPSRRFELKIVTLP